MLQESVSGCAGTGVRIHQESLFGCFRNYCSDVVGIGVRMGQEYTLVRNRHRLPTCKPPMQSAIQQLQAVCSTAEGLKILNNLIENESTHSIFDVKHLTNVAMEFIKSINQWLQRFLVFCVSELIDSNKMWEGYAEDHQGVVLRVHPNLERDSKFTQLRKVIYKTQRPTLYDDVPSFLDSALFGNQIEATKMIMDKIIYTKTLKW